MRGLVVGSIASVLIALTACEPANTTPTQREAMSFRTDTTLPAYLGAPVKYADCMYLSLHAAPLPDVGEPPFPGATVPHDHRALRFTWIRSFHPPIIVRVMDDRTNCRLVTTVAKPNAIYLADIPELVAGDPVAPQPVSGRPARVIRRDSTALAASLCTDLAARLDTIALLAQTVAHPAGLNGSAWLLERVDARGHATLLYWSPDREKQRAVFDAGMAFLRSARVLPTDAREIY